MNVKQAGIYLNLGFYIQFHHICVYMLEEGKNTFKIINV